MPNVSFTRGGSVGIDSTPLENGQILYDREAGRILLDTIINNTLTRFVVKDGTFNGTTQEWEALSDTQKSVFKYVNLTDDYSGEGSGASPNDYYALNYDNYSDLIATNDNLNDYTVPGTYVCETSAIATSLSNCPITKAFKLMIDDGSGTSVISQVITLIDETDAMPWYRTKTSNDSWGEWKQLASTTYVADSAIIKAFVGTCTTAANEKAKVATVDGDFILRKGVRVAIKFSNTNTASNCTLNVNSTGAKSVYYNVAVNTGTDSKIFGTANRYNYYIYDGVYWVWDGIGTEYDTTYSSKAAVSGGTEVSLVTTGEKYIWNNKGNGAVTSVKVGSTSYSPTDGVVSLPAYPTDTNNAVTQTATTTSADYEVLFSNTADNTTRTEGARKNSNLKFNPSTGNLQATQLNGVTIGSSPKFTDTNTWRGIQDNLTSDSTTDSLSAAQGKALKALVDAKGSGTVTQVKVGSTAYNPSSGVISLPAYPTDTNTHRPIQVNGTEILGNNTTALNLKAGSNVSVTNSSGTVTIAATDTTYGVVSSSANGLAPKVTDTSKYLKGDGTWDTPTNTTYSAMSDAEIQAGTSTTARLLTPKAFRANIDNKTWVGTCTTAAATAAKVVTVDTGFLLVKGARIGVKYSNSNTASNCTLNVNSTGAKSIYYDNAVYASASVTICGQANRYIYYVYDGTYWVWDGHGVDNNNTNYVINNGSSTITAASPILTLKCTDIDAQASNNGVTSTKFPTTYNITDKNNLIMTRKEAIVESNGNISAYWYVRNYNGSTTQVGQKGIRLIMNKSGDLTYEFSDPYKADAALGFGFGTCATAAATVEKAVTLASYNLVTNGYVSVKFTNAVPASATMNINSKGAKAIYYKGSAITAGIIQAGDLATFIYNGSQYHLVGIDRAAEGGTKSYSDLTNKPSINNITLSGNKTLSDLGIMPKPTYLTQTLTAGSTSITFTNSAISNNSYVSVYTNVAGLNYTSLTASTGSITLVYPAQSANISVVLEIKNV